MPKTNDQQNNVLSRESPASWNTKYKSIEGFICQLTLRDDNGPILLEKSKAAIQDLITKGCLPYPNDHSNRSNISSGDSYQWCSIHGCHLRRWEKDGRVWYSHKVGDKWCKGGKG